MPGLGAYSMAWQEWLQPGPSRIASYRVSGFSSGTPGTPSVGRGGRVLMAGSGPMAAIVPTAAIASRHRRPLRACAAPTTPRRRDRRPPQPMGARRAPQGQWAIGGTRQSPRAPEAGQLVGGQ